MSDIVERLRSYNPYNEPQGTAIYTEAKLRKKAADEIERLRDRRMSTVFCEK